MVKFSAKQLPSDRTLPLFCRAFADISQSWPGRKQRLSHYTNSSVQSEMASAALFYSNKTNDIIIFHKDYFTFSFLNHFLEPKIDFWTNYITIHEKRPWIHWNLVSSYLGSSATEKWFFWLFSKNALCIEKKNDFKDLKLKKLKRMTPLHDQLWSFELTPIEGLGVILENLHKKVFILIFSEKNTFLKFLIIWLKPSVRLNWHLHVDHIRVSYDLK